MNPSKKDIFRNKYIEELQNCHQKHPSHGYRWLNAKLRMENGIIVSCQFTHRCCKKVGINAINKHYRYKKFTGDESRFYPNLLSKNLKITKPFEVIVSDMTAFWVKNTYYELTLYLDLFNNEIVAYGLSNKKGDVKSYYDGLEELKRKKEEYKNLNTILHTDQGSVYSSKAFNELLPNYNIIRSMSKAGTPTDNAVMEAINGWIKVELFEDFDIFDSTDVTKDICDYIYYFNNERPSYTLNYMAPKNYKEMKMKKIKSL